MGKTDMQIIPAGKMCSLQRYNILIDTVTFWQKNPQTQPPQTILQQCEPYNSN